MYYLPVSPLSVKLLNGCSICEGLIAYCIYVAFSEGAAIGSPNGL